jgi:hypothetical protein
MTTETNREKDTTRPYTEMELFVREQRPGEHDFKIACRIGPNASAGVAEVYGSNVGISPEVARALAHLMVAAPKLLKLLRLRIAMDERPTHFDLEAPQLWDIDARAAIEEALS